jgi:hypothetical protein
MLPFHVYNLYIVEESATSPILINRVTTFFGTTKGRNGIDAIAAHIRRAVFLVYIMQRTIEVISIANQAPLLHVNTVHKIIIESEMIKSVLDFLCVALKVR